jgi:hypothetical protein
MKPICLRLSRQEGACRGRALKNLRITMDLNCYSIISFVQRSGDGDVESLLFLCPSFLLQFLLFLLCPYSVLRTPNKNVIGVLRQTNESRTFCLHMCSGFDFDELIYVILVRTSRYHRFYFCSDQTRDKY